MRWNAMAGPLSLTARACSDTVAPSLGHPLGNSLRSATAAAALDAVYPIGSTPPDEVLTCTVRRAPR